MIDPVTAFAAANAAFKGVKMLVGAGREIQDVSQQLGSWYCAVADITKAESQRKNPTWLDKKTHGTDNIEQEAMDIVIRKKTLLKKRKKLSLCWTTGLAWELMTRCWVCGVRYAPNGKRPFTRQWKPSARYRTTWLLEY